MVGRLGVAPTWLVPLALLVACDRQAATPLLPAPPADAAAQAAPYEPTRPLEAMGEGVVGRRTFLAERAEQGLRFEVRDLSIAPAVEPVMVPLSSAAVLEVLSGRGEALVGDEERSSIAPGSFIPVSHDVRLRITGNEEPLLVRVYLLRAE